MPDDVAAQLSVIEIAIEPKSKADQERLGVALTKLAAEDLSFHFSTDPESGQTILKGTSEEHLDAKVGLLTRWNRCQYRRAAGGVP
jgi:elongation factor G